MADGRDYSVLDTLSEGVQIMDPDWRYLYLNDAVVAQSGYPREALLGRTFLEMYPGVEQTRLFEALRTCMVDRVETRTTNDFTFPDGTTRYFQLRVYPVPEGILIFSLDMTDERARQLIVEHLNEELEDLVARRTAELSAKNRELVQLNYLVSHDLQAPLRTIQQFAAILRRRSAEALDEKSLHFLDRVEGGATRLQGLVDGMLQHGRLGRGAEAADVDTGALVAEVCEDLEASLDEAGGTVEADALPTVHGYREELRVLFQNLVGNALKFARPGVPPRVHIGAVAEDGGHHFTVRDNGRGIAPEHRERVFDLFQRLQGVDEAPGSGVGLAHCEKVVGLHQGRIWVDSVPGEGSTFHFTLRPVA